MLAKCRDLRTLPGTTFSIILHPSLGEIIYGLGHPLRATVIQWVWGQVVIVYNG